MGTRNRRRGNAEGTVVWDKGRNRWRAAVTVGWADDGRQVRRWVSGRTKAEALGRLRELQNAADAGQDPAPRNLTVARFMKGWLGDVLPGTVAPGTETQYRDVERLYVRPHLGQKRLRTLQARDVARMLRALDADGRSPNTCRLARAVLRRALRYAEAEGLVARNVAALADGPRVGTPEGQALTVEEARRFLDSLTGHRLEAAYGVALAVGLRRGELLALTWDDVDLDATPARLAVTRSLRRVRSPGEPSRLALDDLKTRGSRRTVHLPGFAVEALRAHRGRQREERLAAGPEWVGLPLGADLVFRTPFGAAVDPDNFRHWTYRVTEAAGIGRRSPHQLRHSAASLLLAEGVDLKTISEMLGHASIRVTADVYAHLAEPALTAAADAAQRALGR